MNVTMYRPPSGKVESFINHLSEVLDNDQQAGGKEFIIFGDFNINYRAKKSVDTHKLTSWQHKYGLIQHVKGCTRSSQKSSTMLDLIFTSMSYCSAAGVLDLYISDHQPVYLVKKKDKDKRGRVCFKGRSYINYTKDLLSDCLTNVIKESFRDELDPNRCWDLMENFLIAFLNEHCPVKTYRSRVNTPAWISHDIVVLSKDRDKAWELAKKTGNDRDWALARRLRNWTNNAIKEAKSDFIRDELANNRADPKKFWRNIKEVLPDQASGKIDLKKHLDQ